MKKSIFFAIIFGFIAISSFAQGFCDKNIAISKVEVLVDNIREEKIEEQICDIARAQFNTLKEIPQNLEVQIRVRQRSYYKDIDNRNSIYVYYLVCDKGGEQILEDCFCTEGHGSIISAAMQTKQVNKAARALRKFFKTYNAGALEESENLLAQK